MKHLEVKINNGKTIKVSFPENWNDLSPKQLLYIANLWQAWQLMLKEGISLQSAKAMLFIRLAKFKNRSEKRALLKMLSSADFEELDFNPLSLVNFIFETNNLTKNNFKEIRTTIFTKLYGPNDKLSNISINELSFAINYYNQYNSTGNIEYLNLFIACLYRPKNEDYKKTGDIRKPFILETISMHLKQVEKMSADKKQAVYLFFVGCMDFLSHPFPLVFSRAKEAVSSNQTFLDVILKISGGKFGTFDQTASQNAFIVLKELNNILAEQSKTKK